MLPVAGRPWLERLVPLGPRGAFRYAAPLGASMVLVLNADMVHAFDLRPFLEFHHLRQADVTIGLMEVEDPSPIRRRPAGQRRADLPVRREASIGPGAQAAGVRRDLRPAVPRDRLHSKEAGSLPGAGGVPAAHRPGRTGAGLPLPRVLAEQRHPRPLPGAALRHPAGPVPHPARAPGGAPRGLGSGRSPGDPRGGGGAPGAHRGLHGGGRRGPRGVGRGRPPLPHLSRVAGGALGAVGRSASGAQRRAHRLRGGLRHPGGRRPGGGYPDSPPGGWGR